MSDGGRPFYVPGVNCYQSEQMHTTETAGDAADDTRHSSERTQLARLRRGAEGGAIATLVMTAHRLPVSRSLPPTAEFWSKFVSGDDPYDHPAVALVLHGLYGVSAGIAFALMRPSREPVEGETGVGPPAPAGELRLTALGLIFGLVLSIFGEKVVLEMVLDDSPDDRVAFHVGHVLYGVTLGSWLGTRTID